MIKIDTVSKFYGSKQVLKNIDIQLDKGTVTGIVGENGAGKTTLFRCIAALESYSGTIDSEYKTLKDELGFLQTNPYFLTKITGQEYIQLLCNARNIQTGAVGERNIFDLPLNQYASTYSTGMKKKLAFTAILMQENDFFILDEPFNGVDIQSNIIMVDIIHRLKSLGKTILISSHIFSTLRDTCDKILLLKDGEIVRSVEKDEFEQLEKELRAFTVGNKIDKLGLK